MFRSAQHDGLPADNSMTLTESIGSHDYLTLAVFLLTRPDSALQYRMASAASQLTCTSPESCPDQQRAVQRSWRGWCPNVLPMSASAPDKKFRDARSEYPKPGSWPP